MSSGPVTVRNRHLWNSPPLAKMVRSRREVSGTLVNALRVLHRGGAVLTRAAIRSVSLTVAPLRVLGAVHPGRGHVPNQVLPRPVRGETDTCRVTCLAHDA